MSPVLLIASLLLSTVEGFEAFGTFGVILIWLGIIAMGCVFLGGPAAKRELVKNLRARTSALKGVSYLVAGLLVFTVIFTGYPITAAFIVLVNITQQHLVHVAIDN